MTRENAIKLARYEARKWKTPIAVVNAPIENAEDYDGPFGYCPETAVKTLFANATVECVVYPL